MIILGRRDQRKVKLEEGVTLEKDNFWQWDRKRKEVLEIWNSGKGQVRRMQISSPEKVVGSYSASAII